MGLRRWAALAAALTGATAGAGEGEWVTVVEGPITIKNRAVSDSGIHEVWAEGEIAAPVRDIQATQMTPSRFRHFMPYVKDAREISGPQPDGSVYVYTLTEFPFIGRRDYVLKVFLLEGVKADGSGTFRNKWEAHPDYLPQRSDVVRIRVDSGGWVVTPVGDGAKSWAVYRFMVDPGGWVPAFAANLGNRRGVTETYAAVEKEAQRRRDERLAAEAKAKRSLAVPADSGAAPSTPDAASR